MWEPFTRPMIEAVLYLLPVSDPMKFCSATNVSQFFVPFLSALPLWRGFTNHFPGRYSYSVRI